MKDRTFLFGVAAALALLLPTLALSTTTLPFPSAGFSSSQKVLTFSGNQTTSTTCGTSCTIDNSGSNFNIGPADTSRRVHAAVFAQKAGISVASMNICGISAVLNSQQAGTNVNVVIATADVPTGSGSSCGLLVAFNTGANRYGAAVWYSTGLTSSVASSANSQGPCSSCSAPVTALAGGFTLAAAVDNANATFSWSGVVARYSDACAASACQFSAADASNNAAGTLTPAFTGGGASSALVAAAF